MESINPAPQHSCNLNTIYDSDNFRNRISYLLGVELVTHFLILELSFLKVK
ncbi:hypothetical protein Glove_232g46 [Diversispora epigaea]|uniref:Uncharacterized protein n=1 Tax=Diversispora epigaea TaxID=1348612 RepID=A0A397IBX7_9GLOM|nr:hypothetical protein Glove_232g46 [Diversispora epigaea]